MTPENESEMLQVIEHVAQTTVQEALKAALSSLEKCAKVGNLEFKRTYLGFGAVQIKESVVRAMLFRLLSEKKLSDRPKKVSE